MVEYFGEQLRRLRLLRVRLGAVLWHPLRQASDPLRRRLAPAPMTVRWSRFRPVPDERPVKGMLTGPVTMLQWSFVRDDQPRAARPAARSRWRIRDEVADLERPGIAVIQIDEPALREGLPLQRVPTGPVPALGSGLLPTHRAPAGDEHPDPHPHVLLGVQRHHRCHRRARRRRHLDRGLPLRHGAARRVRGNPRYPTRSDPASTTSTHRASLRSRRSTVCWCLPSSVSGGSVSGPIRTAVSRPEAGRRRCLPSSIWWRPRGKGGP